MELQIPKMESEEIENIFWGKIDTLLSNNQKLQVLWLLQNIKLFSWEKKALHTCWSTKLKTQKLFFPNQGDTLWQSKNKHWSYAKKWNKREWSENLPAPTTLLLLWLRKKLGLLDFALIFENLTKTPKYANIRSLILSPVLINCTMPTSLPAWISKQRTGLSLWQRRTRKRQPSLFDRPNMNSM